MNYAVGDDAFSKVELDCPADHQCFTNIAGDKRLIVPPQGSKFDLCEALPNNECSGEAFSTGITMLVKQPNLSWKTSWVLDGGLYAYENKKEVALASATVTRKNYMFVKKDGQVVNGVYSNAYLPAIPLLLLR